VHEADLAAASWFLVTVAYRDMDSRDERFVVDSWAKSFRESDHAGLIQNADWFAIMIPQLEKLVRMKGVSVTVAYDPKTQRAADIYGWICTERLTTRGEAVPLVFYVFVKNAYRMHGIARGLFRAAGVDLADAFVYACKTYVVEELERSRALKRMAPSARYAPMAGRH
jgi:hypothetical protein